MPLLVKVLSLSLMVCSMCSRTWRKERTNSHSCPLTFTHMLWAHMYIHIHKINKCNK